MVQQQWCSSNGAAGLITLLSTHGSLSFFFLVDKLNQLTLLRDVNRA